MCVCYGSTGTRKRRNSVYPALCVCVTRLTWGRCRVSTVRRGPIHVLAPMQDGGSTESSGESSASEERDYWKVRAASLETRVKAASEARKAWALSEAELQHAVSVLTEENAALEARLAKEKEKLSKVKVAKRKLQERHAEKDEEKDKQVSCAKTRESRSFTL
jgi:hypothetical protein